MLQSARDVAEKEGEGGADGAGELQKRKKWKKRKGKGKRRGDGVFPPLAELVVERVRRVHRRPSLFIGQLGRCPGDEIFLMAILIHHAGVLLTSSHRHG